MAYGNSVAGGFVWDDEVQIVKNSTIRSFSNLPTAFTTPFWAFSNAADQGQANFYRPVQTLAYMLGYSLGELSPAAYHGILIALHIVATLLLYLVCLQLAFSPPIALLAAALFAAHPVHTEAVAWIAAVPDVACGALFLAAVWAFLKSAPGRSPSSRSSRFWLAGSAAFYLAALLSKEMAVTLPLFLLLLTYLPPERRPSIWQSIGHLNLRDRAAVMVPFAISFAIYLGLRFNALGAVAGANLDIRASVFDWITLAVLVFGQYVRYILVPYPLIAYHLVPLHLEDRMLATGLAAVAVGAIVWAIWKLRNRIPDAWIWSTAFGVLLIPVFYFPGISTALMAERYLYIPSIAAVLLAASLISHAPSKQTIWTGWAIVALFCGAAMLRNQDWSGSERLYTATLAADSDVSHLRINLSEIAMQRGNDASAREHLELAQASIASGKYLPIRYDQYRAEIGLGALDARAGNFEQARAHLQRAMDLNPAGDWPYVYLAGISMQADQDDAAAIEYLNEAVRLSPINEVARDYLGVALFNQGRYTEASKAFLDALRIDPRFEDARNHLNAANEAMQQQ